MIFQLLWPCSNGQDGTPVPPARQGQDCALLNYCPMSPMSYDDQQVIPGMYYHVIRPRLNPGR